MLVKEALGLKSIHSIWPDVTDINSDESIAISNVELAFTETLSSAQMGPKLFIVRNFLTALVRPVSLVKQDKTDIRVLIFGWRPTTMTMAYLLQELYNIVLFWSDVLACGDGSLVLSQL